MIKHPRIIRVFPTRNKWTPVDEMCYHKPPDMFIPEHDEVHISTVFTWDIPIAKWLKFQWEGQTDKPVLIGGAAFDDKGNGFVPGRYIKPGVTITSRGCPNKCKFCLVPKREGKIRELEIVPGNIIQDNNILACSDRHLAKVFDMLKRQRKRACFNGGLESRRITKDLAIELLKVRARELWLSCDTPNAIRPLQKAVDMLQSVGFRRTHLRVFVLIGDNYEENEQRLKDVFNMGCTPFPQLFQPEKRITYNKRWVKLNWVWSRPAAHKALMKGSLSRYQHNAKPTE